MGRLDEPGDVPVERSSSRIASLSARDSVARTWRIVAGAQPFACRSPNSPSTWPGVSLRKGTSPSLGQRNPRVISGTCRGAIPRPDAGLDHIEPLLKIVGEPGCSRSGRRGRDCVPHRSAELLARLGLRPPVHRWARSANRTGHSPDPQPPSLVKDQHALAHCAFLAIAFLLLECMVAVR